MSAPWCGMCGGTCLKMLEHFGEGDHFPAIEDGEDDDGDDMDAGQDCGRWSNGELKQRCTKAGSEECDWICPIGLPPRREKKKAGPLLAIMESDK